MSDSKWGYLTNEKSLFSCELARYYNIWGSEAAFSLQFHHVQWFSENTLFSVFLIKENNDSMLEVVC